MSESISDCQLSIIVTGGASGIGAAVAELVLERGATSEFLILISRNAVRTYRLVKAVAHTWLRVPLTRPRFRMLGPRWPMHWIAPSMDW